MTIVLPVPGGPKTMYGAPPWRWETTSCTAERCRALSCGWIGWIGRSVAAAVSAAALAEATAAAAAVGNRSASVGKSGTMSGRYLAT